MKTQPNTSNPAGADAAAFEGHTPGDWHLYHRDASQVMDSGGMPVVLCTGPRRFANARLIAAAPTLLSEVLSLHAKLAASEASRAELVGALEQTLDALHNETAITKDSPWIAETKAIARAALARAQEVQP